MPNLDHRSTAKYRAIADALANDLDTGRLKPGTQLPTQRELAHQLGVTVTTVTRGYAEAERRGLITSQVGRGTFVRQMAFPADREVGESAVIDLRVNSLPPYAHAEELVERLTTAGPRSARAKLLDYGPHAGAPHHRAAGAAWIRRRGIDAQADRVLVTAGAQHAIAVTFATLTKPNDVVLTEVLTYAGMKALANQLHFRLQGLPMDEDGLRPDALEAACRSGPAKALYCMPTIQNPTTTVMSEGRRREVAAIAEAHDLTIVEDDSYGFHVAGIPPLTALAPSRSYYLTSTSKSVAPGLRIGYLLVPEGMTERVEAAIFATTVMASPLNAEIASEWIADGIADRVVEWKCKEIAARQAIARRALGNLPYDTHPSSPHIFLRLPEPWRADDFVAQARVRGVLVTAAEEFMVGRASAPHAVRICLGLPQSRAVLEQGLALLAEILKQAPEPCGSVV